jgi:hypothetical protein
MSDQKNVLERINQRIGALGAQLQAAQTALDELALDEAAGKPDARAELVAVEDELAGISHQIERAKAARRAAEKQTTKETIELNTKRTRHQASQAVSAAVDRVALAKKLDDAFKQLGGLLSQWEAVGIEIHNDVADVSAFVAGKNGVDAARYLDPLARFTRGNNGSTGALAHALTSNGVGTRGVYHHELALIRSEPFSFEDFAKLAADRLAAHLSGMVGEQ